MPLTINVIVSFKLKDTPKHSESDIRDVNSHMYDYIFGHICWSELDSFLVTMNCTPSDYGYQTALQKKNESKSFEQLEQEYYNPNVTNSNSLSNYGSAHCVYTNLEGDTIEIFYQMNESYLANLADVSDEYLHRSEWILTNIQVDGIQFNSFRWANITIREIIENYISSKM